MPLISQSGDPSGWAGDSISFEGVVYSPEESCLALTCNLTWLVVWDGGPITTPPTNRDSTLQGVLASALKSCPDTSIAYAGQKVAYYVLCDGVRRVHIAKSDGKPIDNNLDRWKGKTVSLTGRYVRDSINADLPVREWLYVHDSVKTRLLTK